MKGNYNKMFVLFLLMSAIFSLNFYCQGISVLPTPEVKWQIVGYNLLQKVDQDYTSAVILDSLITEELEKETSYCTEKRDLLKTALSELKLVIGMFYIVYGDAQKVYSSRNDTEGGNYLTRFSVDYIKLTMAYNEVLSYYHSAMLVECP